MTQLEFAPECVLLDCRGPFPSRTQGHVKIDCLYSQIQNKQFSLKKKKIEKATHVLQKFRDTAYSIFDELKKKHNKLSS